MRIIHFSDPHAGGGADDWHAYADKRIVGLVNYHFRRRSRFRLEFLGRAVERILSDPPDVVVCTGDLTSTGQPGEFAMVRPYLKPLRDSGIPILYTPGNHDCYVKYPSCLSAVREMARYLNGFDFPFGGEPVVRSVCGVNFILFNTARPSNLLCSWAFLRERDASAIRRKAAECAESGPRVLVNHYPLFEDHPVLRTRHRLFGERPLRRLIEEGGAELSLCGHVHRHSLRVDGAGHGECCAGSLTANAAMEEISCDVSSRTFRFRTIGLPD